MTLSHTYLTPFILAAALASGCSHQGIKTQYSEQEAAVTSTNTTEPLTDYYAIPTDELYIDDIAAESTIMTEIIAEPELSISEEEKIRPTQTRFLFDFNKKDLSQESKNIILQHAEFLLEHPDMRISVNGHSDTQGDTTYNDYLALERAKNVALLLKQYGVNEDQIEVLGWGAQSPIPLAEHHRDNRRVELIYGDGYYAKN